MSEGTTALYILSLEFDYEFKFKYSFLNISGTEFSRYIYDFNVYFYLLFNDILLRGELHILSIPFLCIFMCCLMA